MLGKDSIFKRSSPAAQPPGTPPAIPGAGIGRYFVAAFFSVVVLTLLFGSWYTIDQRERGVILRNGAVVGVAQPGLGFKIPLIDSVVGISVQTHIKTYDEMSTYSRDQQPAMLRVSINYRVIEKEVDDIYANYGGIVGLEDRIITPKVMEQVKIVFGQYVAVTAIQDRGRLNADIQTAITHSIKGPVIIENVQIENIDFSQLYEKSIEERMLAEVEVQKLRQNAEREKVSAEITVTRARAAAEAVLAQARAEAESTRLQGEATAAAIRARGDALRQNQELISLTTAERWNGVLPTTMVPGSALPMITMK